MRGALCSVAFSALTTATFLFTASPAPAAEELVSSTRVALFPGTPVQTRAGKLVFRGGLLLSSRDRRFGGLSDIAVSADGSRILAISDEARWFRARLSYDNQGNLAGLSGGELAEMVDLNGRVLQGKDGDAEDLATLRENDVDGVVLVSFEREHRVWRYDLSGGLNARPTPISTGAWVRSQSPNEGLEGITLISPDTLLLISENAWGDGGGIAGSLETYPGTTEEANSRSLSIVRRPPYMVTAAARGHDNMLYVLERRFSVAGGVGMAIRRIPISEVVPGARLQGELLADLSFQDTSIDNMEGIATRRAPNGATLIYVISDNNFSTLQRNVLMLFEVMP